ncbi:hypothetical protein OIV83_004601 [Microbotryomycetes sp. JL201]|nr:hypothetical protein OIV83_004601 [Microbotryomycetes sp. JL201]
MASPVASSRAMRFVAPDSVDTFWRWHTAPPKPSAAIPTALYDLTMSPWTPFTFGLVYFITAKVLSAKQDGKNRIRGKGWDLLVVLHNVFLAVYSAATFAFAAPMFVPRLIRAFAAHGPGGFATAFCDTSVWAEDSNFPLLAWLFYVSKYYEIVDTAVILAKGKKVGMLQSYHHFGAMLTMYSAYRTAALPVWIFVVFNSGIHAIMYSYYTASTLRLPFPTFLKKSITRLQITQFLVGGSLAALYLFIRLPATASKQLGSATPVLNSRAEGQCLVSDAQRAAVWINLVYLTPLTALFVNFFMTSYKKTGAKRKSA